MSPAGRPLPCYLACVSADRRAVIQTIYCKCAYVCTLNAPQGLKLPFANVHSPDELKKVVGFLSLALVTPCSRAVPDSLSGRCVSTLFLPVFSDRALPFAPVLYDPNFGANSQLKRRSRGKKIYFYCRGKLVHAKRRLQNEVWPFQAFGNLPHQ